MAERSRFLIIGFRLDTLWVHTVFFTGKNFIIIVIMANVWANVMLDALWYGGLMT